MSSEINHQSESGWYVVRTRPKSEHIAALHLRKYANLDEVFCPRIKYEKATQRGKVWFVEALFPGYIFSRFNILTELRQVNATSGVTGVLRFAGQYPQIGEATIGELRTAFQNKDDAIRVVEPCIKEGTEIVVTGGAMVGLKTVVTRLLPGKDRIRILMECLGQEREAEISLESVALPGSIRREVQL